MDESNKTRCSVEEAGHKRTNTVRFHLHEVPGVVEFMETESRMGVATGVVRLEREWGVAV